jgi:hypothetical protein
VPRRSALPMTTFRVLVLILVITGLMADVALMAQVSLAMPPSRSAMPG